MLTAGTSRNIPSGPLVAKNSSLNEVDVLEDDAEAVVTGWECCVCSEAGGLPAVVAPGGGRLLSVGVGEEVLVEETEELRLLPKPGNPRPAVRLELEDFLCGRDLRRSDRSNILKIDPPLPCVIQKVCGLEATD